MGIEDMLEMRREHGNVLERLITKIVYPTDFDQVFKPDKEEKKIVYFK